MKEVIGYALAAIVGLFALTWMAQGNDFFLTKVFAPKMEAVRRETFEQSKAYRQGTIQELQNMELEYVKASPVQQQAMASIILHRAADYSGPMPSDLEQFIDKLKAERGMVTP